MTKDFKETVRERGQALLSEAAERFLADDVTTGRAVLRDYLHATVGFQEIGRR